MTWLRERPLVLYIAAVCTTSLLLQILERIQ